MFAKLRNLGSWPRTTDGGRKIAAEGRERGRETGREGKREFEKREKGGKMAGKENGENRKERKKGQRREESLEGDWELQGQKRQEMRGLRREIRFVGAERKRGI